jgi:hypothetical protein
MTLKIDQLVGEGLVTVDEVEVIRYVGRGAAADSKAPR